VNLANKNKQVVPATAVYSQENFWFRITLCCCGYIIIITQVKEIMQDNVNKVLEREPKIEKLGEKSGNVKSVYYILVCYIQTKNLEHSLLCRHSK
jgi:hypothetical protein